MKTLCTSEALFKDKMGGRLQGTAEMRCKIFFVAWFLCVVASTGPLSGRAKAGGCGISHEVGYKTNGGDGFPLGNRTYTVLIPTGYNPNRSYPLVSICRASVLVAVTTLY